MTGKAREHLSVKALDGYDPVIGRFLWMLDDTRLETWKVLEGVAPEIIDWQPTLTNGNSLGTLLYHIAAIEMDWLYSEVAENKLPDTVWEDFPYPVRDVSGRLTIITSVSLDDHFRRLDATRKRLLDVFREMSLDEFRRVRHMEHYDVTPEWVIHHLIQHEAEHRGEMAMVRALAG